MVSRTAPPSARYPSGCIILRASSPSISSFVTSATMVHPSTPTLSSSANSPRYFLPAFCALLRASLFYFSVQFDQSTTMSRVSRGRTFGFRRMKVSLSEFTLPHSPRKCGVYHVLSYVVVEKFQEWKRKDSWRKIFEKIFSDSSLHCIPFSH